MAPSATSVSVPSLCYWRTQAALSHSELAEKAGVHRRSVHRGENGEPLLLASVRRLAEALGVTPAPAAGGLSMRWEELDDREARCPKCLHWWVSHGVPTEEDYGCSTPTSSMDERARGEFEVCGCTFAEGNTVTPRQVHIEAQQG